MRSEGKRQGLRRSDPPGVALALALLLVGLMFVMALTLIGLSSSDLDIARSESLSIQAGANADAGLQEAKMRLSVKSPASVTWADGSSHSNVRISVPLAVPLNTAWRVYIRSGYTDLASLDPCYGKVTSDQGVCGTATESTSGYQVLDTIQDPNPAGCGGNCGQIKWGWARIQYKVDSAGNVQYASVLDGSITNNSSYTCSNSAGTSTTSNYPLLLITSEGIQSSPSSSLAVRRQVQAIVTPYTDPVTPCSEDSVTRQFNPFAIAAHAKSTISLTGNASTDSYKSSDPSYHGKKGTVSTDSTAAGAISGSGTEYSIDGQVIIGPGGNTSTIGVDLAQVDPGTGVDKTGTESQPVDMPVIPSPPGIPVTTMTGSKTNKDGTCPVMAGGTYVVTDLQITGQKCLNFDGPTVIYTSGTIDISGNGFGSAGNIPANLIVIANGPSTQNVSIGGNGSFYAGVYAPRATINVHGNGLMYGSVIGNAVNFLGGGNTGAFHYDEDMTKWNGVPNTVDQFHAASGGNFQAYSRRAWREIPF